MITAELRARPITGSIGNRVLKYVVIGTEEHAELTDVEAMQAVGGAASGVAPESIEDGAGGYLYGADIELEELIVTPSSTIAFVNAKYGPPEEGSLLGGGNTSPIGEGIYEFSYQAPSAHIYHALSTTAYGTNPPDFGNKIKVRYDGDDLVHDGLDLPAGNTTNVWRLTVPKGFVTSSYESLVESMMGAVNSSTFKGRPAGTMRFVNVQSSVSSGGTVSISWGFQYVPNRTGVTIAGISGIDIGGHQLWWSLDEKRLDLTNKKMVLTPRAIYVQTVFQSADLNQLGL